MTQTEGKTFEWQNTQDGEYLQLCIDRLSQSPLRWIRQFVTLIDEDARARGDSSISVNDLGCCVGGYAGGIKELATVPVDYVGHDISETYLGIAREHFPERQFALLDIATSQPRHTQYSVMSGTIEHVPDWQAGFANVLASTQRTALIRTFLGHTHEFAYYYKAGSAAPYPIQQFTFQEVSEIASAHGFAIDIVRDAATDSIPKYLGCGITRTQYVCKFTRIGQ
jgi:SAM-dependent methyltransferase